MLNAGYIGVMERVGGDETFTMGYLPHTISVLIQEFNNSYEQLGNTRQTIWKDPRKSGWSEPGFGAWVQKKDPNITRNFTKEEMRGLYGVLSNTALLYGEILTNATAKEECEKNAAHTKCGAFWQMVGIVTMQAFRTTNTLKYKKHVSAINMTLCPTANQCFNRPELLSRVLEYMERVRPYTMLVFLKKYEIVSTIPQKDIALGYKMENIIDPTTNDEVRIPGIIKVHNTEQDARMDDKISTFYTCEAGDSKKHQWAG